MEGISPISERLLVSQGKVCSREVVFSNILCSTERCVPERLRNLTSALTVTGMKPTERMASCVRETRDEIA
jgi:hypothetical protein